MSEPNDRAGEAVGSPFTGIEEHDLLQKERGPGNLQLDPRKRPMALPQSTVARFILVMCWHLIHLMVNIVHAGSQLIQVLTCYLVSSGLLAKYQNLRLNKLRYLAIVIDSDEAKQLLLVRQLLEWLSAIGISYVILYDMEGVLKNSEINQEKVKEPDSKKFINGDTKAPGPIFYQDNMSIELLSLPDGKEAIAKAATFLCTRYLEDHNPSEDHVEPAFTEADMTNALKVVGHGGPEPDLLLVFGPARCHLGFPPWRMRYTEIVHMGPLKSMKYGAIVKAIYDFSMKNQNYGS